MKSRCDENALLSYVQTELDSAERTALEEHLAECPQCRKALQQYRAIEDACARLRAKAASPAQAEILTEAVLSRAVELRPHTKRSPRWWALRLGAPVAAAIVIAFFAISLMPGRGGAAWATVEESLANVAWIHTVMINPKTGEVGAESWYNPAGRLRYSRPSRTQLQLVFTDYVRREQWYYEPELNTVTVYDYRGQYNMVMADFFGQLVTPGGPFAETYYVRPVKTEGNSTLFEATLRKPKEGQEGVLVSVWVDNATNLPVRGEVRSPTADDGEAATLSCTIDYPAQGPSDIYAAGVPRTVRVIDGRPGVEARSIINAVTAARDAFPTRYRALTYCSGKGFWYKVERDGDRVRTERYFARSADSREDALRLLEAGQAAMSEVKVCDGESVLQQRSDQPPTVRPLAESPAPSVDSESFVLNNFVLDSQSNPALVSWPSTLGGRVQQGVIRSTDPALAGAVGLEIISEIRVSGVRTELWFDPAHNYAIRRSAWYDKTDGGWMLREVHDTLGYSQLTSGRWYASAIRRMGKQFDITNFTVIDDQPEFEPGTFSVDPQWLPVTVRPVGPDGQAVAGAKLVPLDRWYPQTQQSGDDIVVNNAPAWRKSDCLVVTDDGLVGKVTLDPNEDNEPVTVQLSQGVRLEGFVKEADGSPVEGLSVILQLVTGSPGEGVRTYGLKVAKTDIDGRYVFEGLSPEFDWQVEVFRNGWLSRHPKVSFDAAGQATVGDAVLDARGARFAGRVVDSVTLQPIEGASVLFRPNTEVPDPNRMWYAQTGQDGRWKGIPTLDPAGRYPVSVRADGYKWVDLGELAPEDSLEFALDPVDYAHE